MDTTLALYLLSVTKNGQYDRYNTVTTENDTRKLEKWKHTMLSHLLLMLLEKDQQPRRLSISLHFCEVERCVRNLL